MALITRGRARAGFTLMEMMIVVLIIGVLAAFGVPQYFRSIETTKADDAAALVAMAGTTNRMYALDHSGTYAVGTVSNSCNGVACGTVGAACELTACRYLAMQDWANKAYTLVLANASSGTSCGGKTYGAGSGNIVACVYRRTSGPGSTSISPYAAWGYAATTNGEILVTGAAPAAVAP